MRSNETCTMDATQIVTENYYAIHKVGIITNYINHNYGSVLQSCALQNVLKNMGVIGENIQWHSNKERNCSKLYRIARLGYHTLSYPLSARRRRIDGFRRFRQHYIQESIKNYTSCNDRTSLNDIYDAFICGSDQIWAPNQFQDRYYLEFASDSKRKIAYAPSIGLPFIPEKLKPKMADLLKRIDYLSIREKAGAEVVKQLTGRDAKVVLDPTMLLDRQEWLSRASGKVPSGDYTLCYFLGDNSSHRRAAEIWKRKTGWRLIVLPFRDLDYKWGDLQIGSAGPARFLSLVDGARWILTDSYHGMIFSILMNKSFSAFLRFTKNHPLCQNSRIEHLLGLLELSRQIVDPLTIESHVPNPINYEHANANIALMRRQSTQYLENALGRRQA